MTRACIKRCNYKEAKTFPAYLEVWVKTSKDIFRLQEATAIVWTMIDGKRNADDVYEALKDLVKKEEVEASLQLLFNLKLLKE